jgi:hypothetical protein
MPKRRKAETLIRAYADTDPEIYAWLTGLDDQPLRYGEKGQRIKAMLRRGLQAAEGLPGPDAPPPAPVTADLLSALRAVVEAAVVSALPQAMRDLGEWRPRAEAPAADADAEDAETQAFLATLDAQLFPEEDEA